MAELIREGVRVQKAFMAVVPNKPQHYKKSTRVYSLLHYPVNSTHLRPNITLSTLFSPSLDINFSLYLREEISQPHITKRKMIILYFSITIILQRKAGC
jgi:hypothetical protein